MPKIIIHEYERTAQYFIEDLGNGIQLEMVMIPSGSFMMGSPETEEGSTDDERPQHQVTIKAFCLGKYQVTQAQWKAVAAFPQVNRELKPDPSRFKGDNRPVESVSWEDAVEFCLRLSKHTKRQYRLPSEAEWEYACRAGTTTPFHFGETITTDLANYNGEFTYGDGVEGVYPCTFSASTENILYSYATLVAAAVDAELHTIAWSGKGVVRNYGDLNPTSPDPMPIYYNRTLGISKEQSMVWNPAQYIPDIVIVTLGSNDYSTTPHPSDEDFT